MKLCVVAILLLFESSLCLSHLNVTKKSPNTDQRSITYTVNHIEIFKSGADPLPNEMSTPESSSACGISEISIGEDILVAGTIANEGELKAISCMTFQEPKSSSLGFIPWKLVSNNLKTKLKDNKFDC